MKILPFILIIAVGIAVYANTFANPFIWDDEYSVVKNEYIKEWKHAPKLFTHNFHPFAYRQSIFYRPITSLTLLFDYQIWQFNPFGYHLTNLIFHILSALAVYVLAMRITANLKVGLATGLFFAVHPVHTEAVTYISGRADPIAIFFGLLSFLLFTEFLKGEGRTTPKGIASLFFLALAIWSKEMAVITPLLFILYEISFRHRTDSKKVSFLLSYRYLFISATVIACFLVRYFVVRSIPRPAPQPNPGIGLLFATGLENIASYIGLVFLPLGLSMERRAEMPSSLFEPSLLLSAIIVAALFILTKRFYRKDRIVFFGLGWFALCILPISGIFPLNAPMAEHWLYMPSIGLILAVSQIVVASLERGILSKPISRIAVMTLSACFFVFLGHVTINRNFDWRDPIKFYKKTIRHNPYSHRLYHNLGNEYRLRKQWKEAEASYKEAIRLKPNFAPAHNNLGNIYMMKGDIAAAKREYEESLRYDPNNRASKENLESLRQRN